MTIQDLFHTAPMPNQQWITFNSAFVNATKVIPNPKGWNDPTEVVSTNELYQSKWMEAEWIKGGIVVCISPAKYQGERRMLVNDPRVYWLGLDFDNEKSPTIADLTNALREFDGFWYTTKSHQIPKNGIVCDRYRCFLVYSRPLNNEENHKIHNLLSIDIGHDRACGDATRLFYPSRKGCLHGLLGGKFAVDVDHLLKIANERGITAKKQCVNQVRKLRTAIRLEVDNTDWDGGVVDKKLKKSLNMIWKNKYAAEPDWDNGVADKDLNDLINKTWSDKYEEVCTRQEKNTRDAVWALMLRAVGFTNDLATIGATFENCEWFMKWAARSKEDYRTKLGDAYEEVITQTAGRIALYEPVMPVFPIDYSKLPPLPQNYRALLDKFRTSYNYKGTPEQDRTHQALLHCVNGRNILSIGCGLEKSVAASVYAATYHTDHPVWIVCENHKACQDTLKRLDVLGVPDKHIGYVTGWSETICTNVEVKQDIELKILSSTDLYKPKSPCKNCQNKDMCAFAKRLIHLKREMIKSIVVMSHQMFLFRCQPWSLTAELDYGVSAKTVVLIDEQLRRWEGGTYSHDEIESALNMAGEDTNTIMKILADTCDSTGCIRDTNHSVTGVGIIPENEGVNNRSKAFRSIRKQQLPDDITQKYIEIVTFLSISRKRFVIRQGTNYSILVDRTYWDMPERCVMLDGSARFTQVEWDGFKMWDGGMASVKGLTVHILKGNATKSSLQDPIRFKKYESFYQPIIAKEMPAKVVYAVNQNDSTFTAPTPNDVLAYRGTDTRGSNDFLDGDCLVVLMALFTKCEDYALRAALCTGEPIPCDAIWKTSNYGIAPLMGQCGFEDTRLQLAFMRQAVDECYQAIMRIGVRRYDGKDYHVVCCLPDTLCVAELEGRLPDAKIETQGFALVKTWGRKIYENAGKLTIASLSPTAARLAHVGGSSDV